MRGAWYQELDSNTKLLAPRRDDRPSNSPTNMIRNYLKIAWRNLVRNKTYSILTLLGLASG
ncbi:MAG: hypothetical protein JWP57_2825, partial [Spirosoma sp.]|nr:hypothetical protein [Spirosoma sp.]